MNLVGHRTLILGIVAIVSAAVLAAVGRLGGDAFMGVVGTAMGVYATKRKGEKGDAS